MVEQEVNGAHLESLGLAKHFKIGDVLNDGTDFTSTVCDLFEGRDTFFDSAALQRAQQAMLRESVVGLPALCVRLRDLVQA